MKLRLALFVTLFLLFSAKLTAQELAVLQTSQPTEREIKFGETH